VHGINQLFFPSILVIAAGKFRKQDGSNPLPMEVDKQESTMRRRWLQWGGVIGFLLFAACARQPEIPRCIAPEDNPQHHFVRGMESLASEELETARSQFDRALYCEEGFAPAYSGRALFFALQASRQATAEYQQADVQQALDALKIAKRRSKTPEERFVYHTTAIRVYTAVHGKNGLEEAFWHYRQSQTLQVDERQLLYYEGREAAAYFMGVAYFRDAHNFSQARDLFRQVLDTKRDGRWHAKADMAWRQADKIARATAGVSIGNVARQIAIQDQVSRGDLAALLIDELKIDKLFAGRIPVAVQSHQQQALFTPADVVEHPFKPEVLTVMKWHIRGLEPEFDASTQALLFRPKASVTRKALAIVLEDALIKLTGDEKLASAFLGQTTSPFPDVGPTVPWFNAVMTVVTRNLMETTLAGEFRPNDPADGAEVLLATRVLQQRLNLY
jgi:tetratricopeptide (TPR) repeat protein